MSTAITREESRRLPRDAGSASTQPRVPPRRPALAACRRCIRCGPESNCRSARCGCFLSDRERRLAILTDLGHPAPAVIRMLSGLDALVLEFNHDLQMLRQGPYPSSLKARIESNVGHLSNAQSVQILESIDRTRLTRVVAAHLSRTNNRPHLAREALGCVGMPAHVECDVADQALGLDWRTVGRP
jgi:hypothetical protein